MTRIDGQDSRCLGVFVAVGAPAISSFVWMTVGKPANFLPAIALGLIGLSLSWMRALTFRELVVVHGVALAALVWQSNELAVTYGESFTRVLTLSFVLSAVSLMLSKGAMKRNHARVLAIAAVVTAAFVTNRANFCPRRQSSHTLHFLGVC